MAVSLVKVEVLMPNVTAWAESQPEALGALIAYKSTSITAVRNGVNLAAQTVRLETLSGNRQIVDDNGRTHGIDALALGYKNYPGVADTDLKAGDRFKAGGVNYEVIAIAPAMTDNLQAYLRVRS